MNRHDEMYEITDAFLALRDVDDEAIEGMLRNEKRARDSFIHEGKAFSIQTGSKDVEAAKKFIEEDIEDGDEIEVIDVDADTVDHLKKNTEYIGQAILCCNRCKTNRFIDMDLLTASEVDEEVFNVDDECPHCHDAGAGYSLIGQVGKVQKEEPAAETEAEEAEVENDAVDADEATFDNDVEEIEQEPEAESEETTEEELPEIDTFEEEPENDGMETETSEDELDDLDLPALGDEVDSDETEEDEDNDVKESLNEDVQLNAMAEEAWMMNRVISAMNNEDAYYGSWLYLWPDGETREACAYDFGDTESFEELRDKFIRTYKHYHADGLYDAAPDVVEYAHHMDSQLGLAKIENLAPIKPHVRESFDCSVAADIFNAITSADKIDKIIILDMADEDSEPRTLYNGSKEDLPMNIVGSPCKSFDVADGYLSCNIDTEIENTNRPLSKALECFSDEKTDKILIWDQAAGEEVFAGKKEDACKKFGNCEFISFETPAVIRITIDNPGILSCDELEDEKVETDVNKLVKKIIDANNLSQYKTDKPNTNEYWIRTCIEENDDIELIYESFVKPTENKALIKEFKLVTGYTNALEEAYEAGFAAASGKEVPPADDVVSESSDMDPVIEAVDRGHVYTLAQFEDIIEDDEVSLITDLEDSDEDGWRSYNYQIGKYYISEVWVDQEGDIVNDDYVEYESLEALIKGLEDYNLLGNYIEITDLPTNEAIDSTVTLDQVKAEVEAANTEAEESADKKESVKSFKSRKELAEAVDNCKLNKQEYTIRRSTVEGYRYDLITEDVDSDDVQDAAISLEPSGEGNIEIVDGIPQEMPVEYNEQQNAFMRHLQRVAGDIAEAIQLNYGIDADPQLIIADILRDLKLISGDVSVDELGDSASDRATRELFNSYTEFCSTVDAMISEVTGTEFVSTPEMKLVQAIKALGGPAFSTQNIHKMIGSQQFIAAARGGQVPYIGSAELPQLEAAIPESLKRDVQEVEVCEGCGKCPCECVDEDLSEELVELLTETSVEVDVDQFDDDVNEYLNETYENTIIYTTTDGHIEDHGNMVLEGVIQAEDLIKTITFTLEPGHKINEDFDQLKSETFKVTNNISEEVFEFKFNK